MLINIYKTKEKEQVQLENNLTNEEKRKKEEKEGMLMAIPIFLFFPVIFCYYGFLIFLEILIDTLRKIFPKFENSILENMIIIFLFPIIAYILVGSGFATLWLVNV